MLDRSGSVRASALLFLTGCLNLWFGVSAHAATLTFEFDTRFGEVAPDGSAPWFTAVFDDGGGTGLVTLTMTVVSTIGGADIGQAYFNLDPALVATELAFSRINEPYSGYKKIIRGFGPDHPGLLLERYTATIDAGCGFGGPLLAACFDVDGEIIDKIEC